MPIRVGVPALHLEEWPHTGDFLAEGFLMLQTPDQLGMANSELAQIQQTWSTFHQVQTRLQQEGFVPLGLPQVVCPQYLDMETLGTHDSRALGRLFGQYKAWRDFTAERLAFTEKILLETKNELIEIEAYNKKKLKGDKPGKKVDKEEVIEYSNLNPRYVQLKIQQQENEQLEIWYRMEKDRFSNGIQLISRMLTMRGQDIEQGIRAANVGVQGAVGGPPGYDGFRP